MPIEKTPSTNACRRVKPKIETRAKKIADENHEQVTSCGNGPAQTLMLLCGVRRHRAYLNTHISCSTLSFLWCVASKLHPSCVHDSRRTAKYRFTWRGKYSDRDLTEMVYTHSVYFVREPLIFDGHRSNNLSRGPLTATTTMVGFPTQLAAGQGSAKRIKQRTGIPWPPQGI